MLFQTFTGNFPTGGKLTGFIKSFNKHIGGPCQVIQPQQEVRGQMFRISRNQIGKAKTFEDAARRTKTPIFSENINFPELTTKQNTKSFATMFFDQATPIEGIKKLFNFREQGITEMNRLRDKSGKITNEVKVTFNTACVPHEISRKDGENVFTYILCPSLLQYVRCNKCQKFGHRTPTCTNKIIRCPHCAGPHSHNQCRQRSYRQCANCGMGHGAAYRGCPAFLKYKFDIDLKNRHIKLEWDTRTQLRSQPKTTAPRTAPHQISALRTPTLNVFPTKSMKTSSGKYRT